MAGRVFTEKRAPATFPIGVFGIAVAGAFMNEKDTLMPLLLAVGIMFSAEVLWWFIVWRNPVLKAKRVEGSPSGAKD